jgi:hypothetical protein
LLNVVFAESGMAEISITIVPHCKAMLLAALVCGTREWMFDQPTLECLFQDRAGGQRTREWTMTALGGVRSGVGGQSGIRVRHLQGRAGPAASHGSSLGSSPYPTGTAITIT